MTQLTDHGFLQHIVETANRVGESLTGNLSEVKKLVDENDLVLGVWQDFSKPAGVDLLVIKGEQRILEIASSDASFELKFTAIPCTEFEQAVALKEVTGERYLRH